jgi:hypothetical protein
MPGLWDEAKRIKRSEVGVERPAQSSPTWFEGQRALPSLPNRARESEGLRGTPETKAVGSVSRVFLVSPAMVTPWSILALEERKKGCVLFGSGIAQARPNAGEEEGERTKCRG